MFADYFQKIKGIDQFFYLWSLYTPVPGVAGIYCDILGTVTQNVFFKCLLNTKPDYFGYLFFTLALEHDI